MAQRSSVISMRLPLGERPPAELPESGRPPLPRAARPINSSFRSFFSPLAGFQRQTQYRPARKLQNRQTTSRLSRPLSFSAAAQALPAGGATLAFTSQATEYSGVCFSSTFPRLILDKAPTEGWDLQRQLDGKGGILAFTRGCQAMSGARRGAEHVHALAETYGHENRHPERRCGCSTAASR
jgi:hypothetical protein